MKKNSIARPELFCEQLVLADPGKLALVAGALLARPRVRGEQVHIFARPHVRDERHKAAIAPAREREPRFLAHLAAEAVLRALPRLELAADADPFIAVLVVFLFRAVEHQILAAALHIAECCEFRFHL